MVSMTLTDQAIRTSGVDFRLLFDSSKLNISQEYKNQLFCLQKLFAIFVENPELHELGLSKAMINISLTDETKRMYQNAYLEFRKKCDKRLYGFDL